jgi:hypothetical protein
LHAQYPPSARPCRCRRTSIGGTPLRSESTTSAMKDRKGNLVLTGAGAVMLIGFSFVVITLLAERPLREDDRLRRSS